MAETIALSDIALAETLLNLTNGRALAEIPSTALAVVCYARVIAKAAAIPKPPSCITRPEAAGASLTEIASSEIALAETLLNLTNGRALTDIASTALAVVCHARVVAKPAAKAWIVYPSVSVA